MSKAKLSTYHPVTRADWSQLSGLMLRVASAPSPHSHWHSRVVWVEMARSPSEDQNANFLAAVRYDHEEVVVLASDPGTWVLERPLQKSPQRDYDKNEFVRDVEFVTGDVRDMLIAKNAAYGNSALDPLRIFSRASTVEQLYVRIDDKLSRLKRGDAAGEDVIKDLLGYLVLLRIAQKKEGP